jgi:TolB-like protein
MGGESPKPASTPMGTVFLSYASQDADAAKRICDALRTAGIEVWFDQSELRGGDAWDQSIRKQIKTCDLFIPIVSGHTHERAEGYFRLEWKLAVDRSHLIMANKAFLVPVVIDDTRDDDENVPDKFREVQWTHLPRGDTPPEFVRRIQQLLWGASDHSVTMARPSTAVPSGRLSRLNPAWPAIIVILAALIAYLLAEKPWTVKPVPPSKPATSLTTPTAFNPPPHSIAVLPFVNMSGDKDQEYFSDGLTEELLNSLSRINELQVAARTSSFSFQGEHPDIATVAHKLNVASVLEGSVRRSGRTIRVTAQLNNAVTGFHLWSQTYDRDLGDVLKLQTDIANAVANALKVTLLRDPVEKIELGGTHNPEAFDSYLRAWKAYQDSRTEKDVHAAIALYTEAIGRDRNYALAFAGRSIAFEVCAEFESGEPTSPELLSRSEADARRAIELAPEMAEGYLALAFILEYKLDVAGASEEYQRALALEPGNARVMRNYAAFAVMMGHAEAGITAARHAVVVDPLNPASYRALVWTLYLARRYSEALKALQGAVLTDDAAAFLRGTVYYALGDFEKARVSFEFKGSGAWAPGTLEARLAMVYDKLGRHADATTELAILQKMGASAAFPSAEVYAQWGATSKALECLETAARVADSSLERMRVEPLLDPVRDEPRFKAIERELKFPD